MHKKDLSPLVLDLINSKTVEGEFTPKALLQALTNAYTYILETRIKTHLQMYLMEFLIKLVVVLEEEIKPGSQLKVQLQVGEVKLRDFPKKIYKNYQRLTYRIIIRSGWLFNLVLAIFVIISYSNALGNPFVQFLLYIGVPFYLFFGHMILMFVAERYFGEEDSKIKTYSWQAPRVWIQAQLADGTQFELQISHWFIHKKIIGYRFHKSPLHSTRTKRKRKAKTVTTLKLAFPKKVYPMSAEAFIQKFKHHVKLDSKKVNKIKLKPGEKRNTVIYRDVQSEGGKKAPKVDLDRVIQLITMGGYRRLRQTLPEEYLWDELTRLEGVNQEVATILNNIGVFTFEQLMGLTEKEVYNKVDALRPRPYKYNHQYFYDNLETWQAQARALMKKE